MLKDYSCFKENGDEVLNDVTFHFYSDYKILGNVGRRGEIDRLTRLLRVNIGLFSEAELMI